MSRILPVLALTACTSGAVGLRATPPGDGPMIVVDWDAEPLPEVPYPNDLSAKQDVGTATGLRLNIPLDAPTHFENETRRKLNRLDGFGVYGPISVQFDAPIDIEAILDAHPNDLHLDTTFDDDLFYLIDVTEGSPTYGQPVHLDVGHGRYPYDVFGSDRYFANDTRSDQPSIIFDTVDEDLDGDGVLDPGEDTDNDGLLDKPNVWPPGGDPWEDLLTFYDLQTDTLYMRPVVPLREATTYAVVLTDRLVGRDGAPVVSPWPYVHHTRQTGALAPLETMLPDLGLDLDNVAYAWTFTTGTPTRDLRDLRLGLVEQQGPWAFLHDRYPAGIEEALQISEADDREPYAVKTDALVDIVGPLGLIGEGDGADVLIEAYRGFSDRLVGGAFTTPYLLADEDDGGLWDADEAWRLDPFTGDIVHAPQRVTFSCILPKEREGVEAPHDIVIYGHGYGSSRAEFLLFAPIITRMGFAVCSMDFPGHGPTLSEEEFELTKALLDAQDYLGLMWHLFDSRARDLDNDGDLDSGGDQWTADPFHTRDMVRQAVLDWMQMVRSFRACGDGEMELSEYTAEGGLVATSATRVSCDWDDDGMADIGGPDARIHMLGGSLGGINVGVAAAVLQDVGAFAPIVPGGGIVDVGLRTRIGGAVEAFVGRFMSPLVVGLPTEEGGLQITQIVNSVTRMVELPMATLDAIPVGGEVHVLNLDKGTVVTGMIPEDGRFRVSVAADGMHPGEKAHVAGIPPSGPEPDAIYTVPDNDELGDLLAVEIYDADGELVADIDTWETDVLHEGVTMLAGSPLVAGSEGNGKIRGAADARRQAFATATILEAGDPIAYGRAYVDEPFADLGDGPKNVLVMPTPGDDQVPINAGIALARAAGFVTWDEVDPRYDLTVDAFLIDRQVVRGIEERGPYTNVDGQSVLFDADDYDLGTDLLGGPSDAPLRAFFDTPVGQSGLSLPYASRTGSHGFREPDPTLDFDINTFSIYQIARYFQTDGALIDDRMCLEDGSCPELPPFPAEQGVR